MQCMSCDGGAGEVPVDKLVPGSKLKLPLPDDCHLHLRDGDMLKSVAPLSAAWTGRAIIMPNLVPPVTTTELAVAYHERVGDWSGSSLRLAPTLCCAASNCCVSCSGSCHSRLLTTAFR